jgi:enoyl-CoA hydratase/carnithine racemase
VDENGRDAEGLNAFDREMDRKLARAFDDAGADPESIIVVSHNAGFGADSPVIEEGAMIYVRRPGEV